MSRALAHDDASPASIDFRPDPAARYELIGFDGSRTFAQAVDLDMIFPRKAFRGRDLLTDADRGILGRDLLASLALLFDGPAYVWPQHPGPV